MCDMYGCTCAYVYAPMFVLGEDPSASTLAWLFCVRACVCVCVIRAHVCHSFCIFGIFVCFSLRRLS